jgi:hypothetical protein
MHAHPLAVGFKRRHWRTGAYRHGGEATPSSRRISHWATEMNAEALRLSSGLRQRETLALTGSTLSTDWANSDYFDIHWH